MPRFINRLKKGESTHCRWTTTGQEIKEGDILGYGDNYPCIVLYDGWEGKFVALEFGYKDDGYLYRNHDLKSYIYPYKVLGNIDDNPRTHLLKKVPQNFDYNKDVEKYYLDKYKRENVSI